MGALPDAEADKLLSHASTCDSCAGVLSKSLHALEGNPSPEETAAIAELAAAKAEWQQAMARKLASTSARRRSGFGWPVLTFGALAAGVLIAAFIFFGQRKAHAPEHELALAYSESRNLELRIPDAVYSGLTTSNHTRGALSGHETAALLEARAHLARLLDRSPQDPRALQLQARADVLEEHYDAAVDVLDRLLAAGPVTAELLADAASAYYQRGLISGSELDRSAALDYLRRADELAPTDPVILFNEAIVMEERGQMMNAVEVWNRFLTVERNQEWAAEGRRKLATLEQTLNRLKTHESRISGMIATPEAMEALAVSPRKLAEVDEEMTSMRLDQLLPVAFPISTSGEEQQQSRGSPCSHRCQAMRKLLIALSLSLKTNHSDFWLADLLPSGIDSIPASYESIFAQALQSLSIATRENQTGTPAIGLEKAKLSQQLFEQLVKASPSTPLLRQAAQVGEQRAAIEHLFALQRTDDYLSCHAYAEQLRARPHFRETAKRYSWMDAVTLLTEKVCGDTPETRAAGQALTITALRGAEASHYPILKLRIQARSVDGAQSFDDGEATERACLSILRQLYSADMPPYRIVNTFSDLIYIEINSPRAHMAESSLREMIAWEELIRNKATASELRMELARAELKIGALHEAERQLTLAYEGAKATRTGRFQGANFGETETRMASSMLEWGDFPKAANFLKLAQQQLALNTNRWSQEQFVITRGMLDLSTGNYAAAASGLEAGIATNEGRDLQSGDSATAAEYAQHDHDLYAELAAAWIAEGRSPASVLALWERFRLRSRGLPVTTCAAHQLDCEQSRLLVAQARMGADVLTGQILLLDRVLVYRVDRNTIQWTQNLLRRQDVLDSARTLERAVSSPFTSPETARILSVKLSAALLPKMPETSNSDFTASSLTVLIEPDPLLENLAWPVLTTPAGPLGIHYPLAESRSILTGHPGLPADNSPVTSGVRPLVIGASVTSGQEPPLPETLNEATNAGRFLHLPSLLLGSQATADNVAANLGTATSFHFAGHAQQTERGTQLLLASATNHGQNPWIDGTFLRQHPPHNCRLAVLSACSTGKLESSWIHPLQDIVETLSSLGVPNVVATRWQIDSKATVPFMDEFYSSLAQGKSPAIALSSARKLQFGQLQYNNPYYWGAYYVTSTERLSSRREKHASP